MVAVLFLYWNQDINGAHGISVKMLRNIVLWNFNLTEVLIALRKLVEFVIACFKKISWISDLLL